MIFTSRATAFCPMKVSKRNAYFQLWLFLCVYVIVSSAPFRSLTFQASKHDAWSNDLPFFLVVSHPLG